MQEKNFERNAGYMNHLRRHARDSNGVLLTQTQIARTVGMDGAHLTDIKQGKSGVSPEVMTRTVQAYPPKTWEELAELGRAWEVPKTGRTPQAPAERNEILFKIAQEKGLCDSDLVEMLGVSKGLISQLRTGRKSLSENVLVRALQKLSLTEEEARNLQEKVKNNARNSRKNNRNALSQTT